MISNVLKKIFGSRNDRLIKQYRRKVVAANGFEAAISKLSDDQLRAKTDEFRARIKAHLDAANVSGGAGQANPKDRVTEIDVHFNAPDKLAYACRLLRKQTLISVVGHKVCAE